MDIKKIRKELGLTQSELAEKLGVSSRAVQTWENGERAPSIATISLIRQLNTEKKNTKERTIDELITKKVLLLMSPEIERLKNEINDISHAIKQAGLDSLYKSLRDQKESEQIKQGKKSG